MQIKPNYILIPLLVLLIALGGSYLTARGLNWYGGLRLPAIVPDGRTIGGVWTILYILAAFSALLFWNAPRKPLFGLITVLFGTDGILNVLWSFIFFVRHDFSAALVEMSVLNFLTFLLILFLLGYERRSAFLLVPYFLWVAVATYLTYLIGALNG